MKLHAIRNSEDESRTLGRPGNVGQELSAKYGVEATFPLKRNGTTNQARWAVDADAIGRVVRKHVGTFGLVCGYSAHSMRATFITTALGLSSPYPPAASM